MKNDFDARTLYGSATQKPVKRSQTRNILILRDNHFDIFTFLKLLKLYSQMFLFLFLVKVVVNIFKH